jgi:hypothetical protein
MERSIIHSSRSADRPAQALLNQTCGFVVPGEENCDADNNIGVNAVAGRESASQEGKPLSLWNG